MMNMNLPNRYGSCRTLCQAVLLLLLLITIAGCNPSPGNYQWTRETGSLALSMTDSSGSEHLLWKYNFQPGMKPFFHPLHAPDGTLLTAQSPPDHPWHLGLWFCWKYINGLNYWEYKGDPELAVSEGMTDLKDIRIRTQPDGSADIRMDIDYHPWEQQDSVVLAEDRIIRVSAPDEEGGYHIDFEHVFTAVTDVLLDRTPVSYNAQGVPSGGYAGLSIRFSQDLSSPRYFSPGLDSMISGTREPWVGVNLLNENGKTVQLVIIDDPSNPRHPSPWYCINRPAHRFWFYSPALLWESPMELKAGETIHLRYRVLLPAKVLTKEEVRRA